MANNILVTGASGFLGRSLVLALRERGANIIELNRDDGDIANLDTFKIANEKKIDHIFHLAGKTFIPDSWDDPLAFYQANVIGTINVLEFCRKKNVPLTYVSAYVYGETDKLPISENHLLNPGNPYALTKIAAEDACKFYAKNYNFPITVIRPFNVYGPDQKEFFLIPFIVKQVIDEGNVISVRDLRPRRDYVYLDDLVTALLATLNRVSSYQAYNIGSGISYGVDEVIEIIQRVAGTQKVVTSEGSGRMNDESNIVADISEAHLGLGWSPKISFEKGIEKILLGLKTKRSAI